MAETDTVRTAVEAQSRYFEECYNAGDAQGLVSGYFVEDADEPMACPPASTPLRGRAALTAMFSGMFQSAPTIRLETLEVVGSDSVAYELGRAHLGLVDGGTGIGRYTVCWVNRGGEWRAKVDFFTEDGWAD